MNFSNTKRPKNDLIKYYVNLKKYKEKMEHLQIINNNPVAQS